MYDEEHVKSNATKRLCEDVNVRSCSTKGAANVAQREQRMSLNKKNHTQCLYKFLFKILITFHFSSYDEHFFAVIRQLSETFTSSKIPSICAKLNCDLYLIKKYVSVDCNDDVVLCKILIEAPMQCRTEIVCIHIFKYFSFAGV